MRVTQFPNIYHAIRKQNLFVSLCFQMKYRILDNNEHKQNLPKPLKQKLVQAVWQMSAIGELSISKVFFNSSIGDCISSIVVQSFWSVNNDIILSYHIMTIAI